MNMWRKNHFNLPWNVSLNDFQCSTSIYRMLCPVQVYYTFATLYLSHDLSTMWTYQSVYELHSFYVNFAVCLFNFSCNICPSTWMMFGYFLMLEGRPNWSAFVMFADSIASSKLYLLFQNFRFLWNSLIPVSLRAVSLCRRMTLERKPKVVRHTEVAPNNNNNNNNYSLSNNNNNNSYGYCSPLVTGSGCGTGISPDSVEYQKDHPINSRNTPSTLNILTCSMEKEDFANRWVLFLEELSTNDDACCLYSQYWFSCWSDFCGASERRP